MTKKALVGNAADPQQVAQAEQKEKQRERRRIADIQTVLATRPGRRFLWALLCECGIFQSEFHQNGSFQYFVGGIRNVGCKLLAEIEEADPTAYQTMAIEAKHERDAS